MVTQIKSPDQSFFFKNRYILRLGKRNYGTHNNSRDTSLRQSTLERIENKSTKVQEDALKLNSVISNAKIEQKQNADLRDKLTNSHTGTTAITKSEAQIKVQKRESFTLAE